MSEDVITTAELLRLLQRIEDGQNTMRKDFHQALAELVRRDSWEIKNESVDREIKDIRTQISLIDAEHKTDLERLANDLRAPKQWPIVVATITSLSVAVLSLIRPLL